MRRSYGWLAMAIVPLLLEACSTFVAHKIEHPDRSQHQAWKPVRDYLSDSGFRYESFSTSDGVRLAYWRGDPRAYAIKDLVLVSTSKQRFKLVLDVGDASGAAAALTPRGSVVLLHPWEMEGAVMLMWAYHFAAAGYVVVMPDLRAQGGSSLAPVGFGPREGDDVAQLVSALRRAHQLPDPLYLMGASYGGSVALFAAKELGDVRGVVALEPYANAADVIRQAPATGMFGSHWLASLIGPASIDAGIERAGRELGVDLNQINAADTLGNNSRCTLVIRGAHDTLLSADALRDLAAHSPQASYVEVSDEGHITLPARSDRIVQPLLAWMAQVPADTGNHCPGFEPLPAPPPPTAAQRRGWSAQYMVITGGT
ncbi:alpha/beta hydrolase [Dyella sp. 20L07]|uniref:alpha/beta hydrolase n=1 Tax=Dyella sp. 20L07 TaxID=3384240 RepID=UPI003D28A23E